MTIYAYLKYKYLKNIICLLMEVSQSSFLTVILLSWSMLCSLNTKRFDEIIMDFYQDAGIWIVIASCVAEYLLLITYIAVAAYEFFKNRKMMKNYIVNSPYVPVVYYEGEEEIEDKLLKSEHKSPEQNTFQHRIQHIQRNRQGTVNNNMSSSVLTKPETELAQSSPLRTSEVPQGASSPGKTSPLRTPGPAASAQLRTDTSGNIKPTLAARTNQQPPTTQQPQTSQQPQIAQQPLQQPQYAQRPSQQQQPQPFQPQQSTSSPLAISRSPPAPVNPPSSQLTLSPKKSLRVHDVNSTIKSHALQPDNISDDSGED
jgi:hypothetical protein